MHKKDAKIYDFTVAKIQLNRSKIGFFHNKYIFCRLCALQIWKG